MRTALLGSLLLLASTPAFADPCEVTVSRAPDDVRAAIEEWVAAEPSCSTTADVRVVVTDGGYYLLAMRSDGRVHERVVPDAQSAGVLVASWIAADEPVSPEPAPTPAPAPVATPVAVEAPVAHVEVATPHTARWLTIGPTIVLAEHGVAGLRAEIDVKRWGRWSVGLAAGLAANTDDATADVKVLRGMVEAAHTTTRGPWSLRFAAGVGVVAARYLDPLTAMPIVSSGGFGEVSALVSRRIGDRWAVAAGPLLDAPLPAPDSLRQLQNVTLFVAVGRSL